MGALRVWRRISGRDADELAREMRTLGREIHDAANRLREAVEDIQKLEEMVAEARKAQANVKYLNERRAPDSDRRRAERRQPKTVNGC